MRSTVSDPPVVSARDDGSRRRELATFLLIAFGVPWLLWLLRLRTGVDVVAAGGMLAAGLATFVAVRWVGRPASIPRDTALAPLRPAGRLVRYCGIAFVVPLVLAFLAVAIGALAGVYPLDLENFSGLRSVYAPEAAHETGVPVGLILSALATGFGLFVLLLPLAFCEEWAWRGFLLPRLRPLGPWPALLLSGLIWGLWHLPGYAGTNATAGLVPFLVTTVFFGVLLGWLRLASGLIWPGVIAHAVNNTLITGFVNVVFAAGDQRALSDPWTVGLSGWPGWLVMLATVAVLVVTGAFRRAAVPDGPGREGRPRRWRRILAAFLAVAGIAALAGASAENSLAPADARRFPAPGRLVGVGTHQLHLRCLGSGWPTVVFESGWGDSSTTWDDLQRRSAASGQRSCAYDRAGYAWSRPGPDVRDVSAEADDLAALLRNAGERGPYVFVGHSWGGHVLRVFRARRPGSVAGLVLLDVADERSGANPAALATVQANVWSFLAGVGLLRTGAWMTDPREPRLTRDNVPVVFGPGTWAAAAAEMRGFEASTRTVQDLPREPGSWGSLPLTVVSAAGDRETAEHHARIARLSTLGRHVVASSTDHYLHLADPALVAREIRRVTGQARRNGVSSAR
ncbi:pimeloyl-ACP methyl ester carboxylesterase [Nonomuraea fuscirosea]|uniref:Pimeloyl-ACP methyl ester carboxylesterase n=1 Tax=Nonomuraea fuscirosea TaxID=1291556 RepID=A0A2T0N2S8_9ACTN|nr:alpha/beta fold hydrolase [Nonomuraea fuscirosea]PRX66283.1 pimeloyl-ACP methyl ester carboxylesterase [Nonomuraea fuscirosea]